LLFFEKSLDWASFLPFPFLPFWTSWLIAGQPVFLLQEGKMIEMHKMTKKK